MKKIKNLLLTLCLFAGIVLLSSCTSGSSDNYLHLNGESGTLTLVYSDNYKEQDRYIYWTAEEVTDLVKNNCPEDLIFSYEDNGETIQYTFEMEFENLDEYAEKCQRILDYGHASYTEPLIEHEFSGSLFKTNIYYRENFRNTDLLLWFKDLLINNNVIASGNAPNIIGSAKTHLYYFDREYSSGDYLEINTTIEEGLRMLDYSTTVIKEDDIIRRVTFHVNRDLYVMKSAEIETFLEGFSEYADKEIYDDENNYVTIINLTCRGDISKINEFMKVFEGDRNDISFSYDGKDDEKFKDSYTWKENVYLNNYLNESAGYLFNYYLDNYRTYEGTYTDGNVTDSLTYEDLGSAFRVENLESNEFDIYYNSNLDLSIDKIEMAVDFTDKERVTRETTLNYHGNFVYEDYLLDIYREIFVDSVEIERPEGNVIRITTKENETHNIWNELFSTGNTVSGTNACSIFKLYCNTEVNDSFDFRVFTDKKIGEVDYIIKDIQSRKGLNHENGTIVKGDYIRTYHYFEPAILNFNIKSQTIGYFRILLLLILAYIVLYIIDSILTKSRYANGGHRVIDLNMPQYEIKKDYTLSKIPTIPEASLIQREVFTKATNSEKPLS